MVSWLTHWGRLYLQSLVQIMEYCWIDPRNNFQWNINRNEIFIQENVYENVICEMATTLSRPQCVKFVLICYYALSLDIRADSMFVPSQWETALLCNDVSHWLGASLESALNVLRNWFYFLLISFLGTLWSSAGSCNVETTNQYVNEFKMRSNLMHDI